MHSYAVAGFLVALAAVHAVTALYCAVSVARRRAEREVPVFGLLNVTLVFHDIGLVAQYATLGGPRLWLGLPGVAKAAATVFLVHYVLEYTRSSRPRWTISALYGAGFVSVALAAAAAASRAGAMERRAGWTVFGDVPDLWAAPSPLSLLVEASWIGGAIVAVALVGRAFDRGRQEGAALAGCIVLAAAALQDGARAIGWIHAPPLAPYGFALLVTGMIMTALSRFAALRQQLERRASRLRTRAQALSRSYAELRAAQDELVRKEQLAAVGELSAVVAHEVRNPLAIIANAVATLRRPEVTAEDRETLHAILDEETSRLNRLVGDLLSYARPIAVDRQLLGLRAIAERALSLARAHPTIAIELSEPEPAPKIWGDPGLLRHALENLIDNAVQAMPGGGALALTLRPLSVEGAAGVEIQIRDSGVGMDAQTRSRALDPFFTTRPTGTGLGLSIVARIVDAHGGRVQITSAPSAGTVVHVFLPVAGPRTSDPPDRQSTPLPPLPIEIRKSILGR